MSKVVGNWLYQWLQLVSEFGFTRLCDYKGVLAPFLLANDIRFTNCYLIALDDWWLQS